MQESAVPDFVNIGAMKCGTTALYHYLRAHPGIAMSRRKETNFFIAERNWSRGPEWYARQFPAAGGLRGDCSPGYANYPYYAGVPQRIRLANPGVKLLYLVRDPVDRIVSHYMHRVAEGSETRSIAEVVDAADEIYLTRSRYALQIEQYLDVFPLSQILIACQEDLDTRRIDTLRDIFRFLGVDGAAAEGIPARRFHASAGKRKPTLLGRRIGQAWLPRLLRYPTVVESALSKATMRLLSSPLARPCLLPDQRRRIQDLLASDMERFEAIAGRRFDRWRL